MTKRSNKSPAGGKRQAPRGLTSTPARGPGRPKKAGAGVAHIARPSFEPEQPLLIQMRIFDGLPSMRRGDAPLVVRRALGAGRDRFGFRLRHAALRTHELLLVVEADDRVSLSRGMKGLKVRLARRLNGYWGRSEAVFSDRYEVKPLFGERSLQHVLTSLFGDDRIEPIDPSEDPGER